MIGKTEMKNKPSLGVPNPKPNLSKKSVLEGIGLNTKMNIIPPKKSKTNIVDKNKQEEEKFTEDKIKKFEEELAKKYDDIATMNSDWKSLYEAPVDKPVGLNLEKFLNHMSDGITTTQTIGTMGQVPSVEVQRKIMEDVIKPNKVTLSIINNRKTHLENIQK